MNVFEQHILDTITKIKGISKKIDTDSILQILTPNSATNITLQDVQDKIQFSISISKTENRQTEPCLDSFFIAKQSDLEGEVYDILMTLDPADDAQLDMQVGI